MPNRQGAEQLPLTSLTPGSPVLIKYLFMSCSCFVFLAQTGSSLLKSFSEDVLPVTPILHLLRYFNKTSMSASNYIFFIITSQAEDLESTLLTWMSLHVLTVWEDPNLLNFCYSRYQQKQDIATSTTPLVPRLPLFGTPYICVFNADF